MVGPTSESRGECRPLRVLLRNFRNNLHIPHGGYDFHVPNGNLIMMPSLRLFCATCKKLKRPTATTRIWLNRVCLCLGRSNAPVPILFSPLELVEACSRVADVAVHSDRHSSSCAEACDVVWELRKPNGIESSVFLRDEFGGIITSKKFRAKGNKKRGYSSWYRMRCFAILAENWRDCQCTGARWGCGYLRQMTGDDHCHSTRNRSAQLREKRTMRFRSHRARPLKMLSAHCDKLRRVRQRGGSVAFESRIKGNCEL